MVLSDDEQYVLDEMKILRDKLKACADDGPGGENVELTPAQAMLAYRLMFGDAQRG